MVRENCQKLIAACQKSLRENEYNIRKIKGVALSHSDVETAILYAETIQNFGTYEGQLMRPVGAVHELLTKFNVI